ncbi:MULTISPECIES: cholesterol oxidase substrate-binding domain-containing protein [Burkholderiaceae]|uniref:cholesterol oxidase substrate-binding domain-containing protein n=1 Tax=Burkholderiaceae TaxID=119060 RepID=UPI00095C2462|nr:MULTISPECIES: cholesterol oxidase substrate-binding domain-containing protein [Burkholderiaceae]MCG1018975.1 FAD-binding protein [Mycetohabitans sp. B4]SIT80800.1 FAD binding domain-containing protein [Burkholderia sp. b13]
MERNYKKKGCVSSRRKFLSDMVMLSTSGIVAGGWTPIYQISANASETLVNFPVGISIYRQAYENWSREIFVDNVWTAVPKTPDDIVSIVNWARSNDFKVRPRGYMHNWSPLTMDSDSKASSVVLLDMTKNLTAVSIDTASKPARVTAQTGVSMGALLEKLETKGLGMTAVPAPGDITLGGALAIGAHGTAVPAKGEKLLSGHTYGSLSNLILSLSAVVYDETKKEYILRTFSREEADISGFLTHVGRACIVEVTMQVGENQRLRCRSHINISANELFAKPGASKRAIGSFRRSKRTIESFLDKSGRIEVIWFPFTSNPWLKVWSVRPNKPLFSRVVTKANNYPFSDWISIELSDLIKRIVIDNEVTITPVFGQKQLAIATAGLVATHSLDIWGWSKNLLQYIRPTTLRVTANGYAVVTSRANVQRVISDFIENYQERINAYQKQNQYPINGPLEIRVSGLDNPNDVSPSSVTAALSVIKPRLDRPDWDIAVWFDILTLPGTPHANKFYRETEQWMFSHYAGSYATMRPEWSKGWAYTDSAAWNDYTTISTTIPNIYREGQISQEKDWDKAIKTLNKYDPNRIFSSALLDKLLPSGV